MNKSYQLVLICFFVLFTCNGQSKKSMRGILWINIDYIKDMENYLPCECADSANYWISVYIIARDSINDNNNISESQIPEVELNQSLQIEPSQFYIISETSTKCVISNNIKSYDLILRNDTLLMVDNFECQKFVKQSTMANFKIDNIELLNRSLSSRGYPKINTFLKEDSLKLSCAPSWGNINLVCSVKKRNKFWVLEIVDNYLYIYKVTNPNRDPYDPVLKKEIKRLKWETYRKVRNVHKEKYPKFVPPR